MDEPNKSLVVNEIFGPTVQGEGPSAGRRCAFLRLGGCNLTCRWCDTPYTWDWKGTSDERTAYDPRSQLHPMAPDDVLARLLSFDVGMVVVSGGEPLSQQRRLLPVVERLRARGVDVEIETNGTLAPSPDLVALGVSFNVSPKLGHAGIPLRRRIVPAALREFAASGRARFKFVCGSEADLDEVGALVDRHGLEPVWIMPLGRTAPEVVGGHRALVDATVARGWNMTTRLHVLAWGDKRGV